MNAKSPATATALSDDAPELTDAFFEQADEYRGDKLIRRGRPAGESNKVATNVRYDRDLVDAFKSTGAGWQTRMNDALRDWANAHGLMPRH